VIAGIGPAELVAGVALGALTAYVLLGGADFGGGVWDLLASGPRKREQRALIAEAIGPIWEANHVWLIIVIVVLFTCFPVAFARLAIALHIPLSLMLIGIVLRGSAFVFRSHYGHDPEPGDPGTSRRWGRVFAIASAGTPVLLGLCVGALAAGTLRPPGRAGFYEIYVAPWLTPFGVGVGRRRYFMNARQPSIPMNTAATTSSSATRTIRPEPIMGSTRPASRLGW